MIATRSLDEPFRTEIGNGRLRIDGDLTAPEREALEAAARSCLLGQTLRRTVALVEDPGLELGP